MLILFTHCHSSVGDPVTTSHFYSINFPVLFHFQTPEIAFTNSFDLFNHTQCALQMHLPPISCLSVHDLLRVAYSSQ